MCGYLGYNYIGVDVSNQIADIENYSESFGDVELVSTQNTYTLDEKNDINNGNTNENLNKGNSENTKNTSSNSEKNNINDNTKDTDSNRSNNINENDYFEESRLERDKMYSETLEVYENILSNDSITNEQKVIAENEITEITNIKSGILIAENLIKVKGFEDVVIFINDAKATVIVKSDKLKKEEIAQIQNIIINQLMIDINDISISSREN